LIDDFRHLKPGRDGFVDAPCPLCSSQRKPANQGKKVCRVWFRDGRPVGYKCVHCGASGPVGVGANGGQSWAALAPAFVGPRRVPAQRSTIALEIWDQTQPLTGTLAETYLRRRGVKHLKAYPDDVRFHPACPFGNHRLPCLVALVRDINTDTPIAIHRTALKPDGSNKYFDAASGISSKMMLGPVVGGAIKLAPDESITTDLGLAEGLETGLALLQKMSVMWVAMSAGGLKHFPILPGIGSLVLWGDHDPTGIDAATTCAVRWRLAGAHARVMLPNIVGMDWADRLRGA